MWQARNFTSAQLLLAGKFSIKKNHTFFQFSFCRFFLFVAARLNTRIRLKLNSQSEEMLKISFWLKLARYRCSEWFFPIHFLSFPPSHKASKEIEWKMNDDKISNFHIFHGAPSTEWGIYCIEKKLFVVFISPPPTLERTRVSLEYSTAAFPWEIWKKSFPATRRERDRLGAQLTPQMYIMENFQLSFSPEQPRELNENGKFLHFAIFSLFSVPPTPIHGLNT